MKTLFALAFSPIDVWTSGTNARNAEAVADWGTELQNKRTTVTNFVRVEYSDL